ncbi:S-adenosyl-L-methionine-dependent methyltransferase [Pyronema domesticum]|uniref:Similar to Spermidine synthase acc. no. Q8D3Q3 n=1 Tax=Pyronema omphalodes (strain CBS 100304) TaxID=1076935 RepID=U4LSM4_PYROM|nr:S-adenosyl-L-methionine-dependent methyltransferase [Pyronema domesticum]CCX32345.1 Similar to Spermidine synthase; acc. no. Q8D3Q3 [Pyronema omphalodes CBS 100304]
MPPKSSQRTPAKAPKASPPTKQALAAPTAQRSALPAVSFARFAGYFRGLIYILAAATASYVSQLTLAPVYGEIPSSLHHEQITTAVFFAAWILKPLLRKAPLKLSTLIPVIVFHIPGLLNYLFQYSTTWGAVKGPIITEALTVYPVILFSIFAAATNLETGSFVLDAIPAGLSWGIFAFARQAIPRLLWKRIGSQWLLTRCGMHHALGALYTLLAPSLLLATTMGALFHSYSENPLCVLSPSLNATLAPYNHSIIARTESVTGYVSVLDNFEMGYRVLRCDHSLLGGEWQRAPKGFPVGEKFKEPIYAIFVTMEAVRLVEPAPKNEKPSALAIGLGIGTSTDAMIRHGIQTDIVELDPAVYKYATEYFGLSKNHTAYLEDAVGFIEREVAKGEKKYEYILHDVFTGGAVPASLFTLEVFEGLKALLAEDGVVAINWAGDLKLPAARSIIRTIRHVFQNCRVFREEPATEDDIKKGRDFTNMVIFCTPSPLPYSFRRPVQSDLLGSYARQRFLYPKYEIDLEEYWGKEAMMDQETTLLREGNVDMLREWQKKSAVGHWSVIRTVVPGGVWENY